MNNFEIKHRILQMVAEGKSVVIIDPENEYVQFAKALDGHVSVMNPNEGKGAIEC